MSSLSTISSIDLGTDVITTSAAHGLTAGDAVGLHAGLHNGNPGTLPTASVSLAVNSLLFAGTITSTTFKLYQSKATAIAETSAIDITAAGLGTLYVTRLTVKERLDRRLKDIIEAHAELNECQRIERRGNDSLSVGTPEDSVVDAFLVSSSDPNDSDSAMGDNAGAGLAIKLASYQAIVIYHQADEDREPTMNIVNRWQANLENLVTADPKVTEALPSSQRLAVDLSVVSTLELEIEEGQGELAIGIEFEVEYQHQRNDAYELAF